MRKVLRDIIENEGHTVVGEACDGNDAIKKYVQLQPNLVIMDITMPEVDGIEALKRLKIIDHHAKIIMCSAIVGQKYILNKVLSEGALGIILKPFKKCQVIDAVHRALSSF